MNENQQIKELEERFARGEISRREFMIAISALGVTFALGISPTNTEAATKTVAMSGTASGFSPYVEDVFSTNLYQGNGSAQSVANGIDLAGQGGFAWLKPRSTNPTLSSFGTDSNANALIYFPSGHQGRAVFSPTNVYGSSTPYDFFKASDGWYTTGNVHVNYSGLDYASWIFRKAPKFLDVVTYTGDGTANRQISHSLGVAPGMVLLKTTNTTSDWKVFHRSQDATSPEAYQLLLNSTAAVANNGSNGTIGVSSTTITVHGNGNTNADAYVAFIFAHDASATGIVQCGSFTSNGSGNATVSLGWEPQYLLVKRSSATENWWVFDSIRGFTNGTTGDQLLYPNLNNVETNLGDIFTPTATGFTSSISGAPSQTYVYLAIRRGPMRVPTAGTQVYNAIARTGSGTATNVTGVGFAPDLVIGCDRTGAPGWGTVWTDRLRGPKVKLLTQGVAEDADSQGLTSFDMNGYSVGTSGTYNQSGDAVVAWNFRRAPSFFDEVIYAGDNGAGTAYNHNLTVLPELILIKCRNSATPGWVLQAWTSDGYTGNGQLNGTGAFSTGNVLDAGTRTASVFYSRSVVNGNLSTSGNNHVAYLFASCPGVSKIGSYTGNGSATGPTTTVGFQPRWLMVKRADSTGNWCVWDSARSTSNPRQNVLFLNATSGAETTSGYNVDFNATGFQIKSTSTDVNANGGTYLYMAIS